MVQSEDFSVLIIRTRRKKTVSVQIKDGSVSILVPKNLPHERIVEIIQEKGDWIRRKLLLQSQLPRFTPRNFIAGERFVFAGRDYTLQLETAQTQTVCRVGDILQVCLPPALMNREMIKAALEDWYQQQASQVLHDKVRCYAAALRVQPASVAVKTYKSRWGSCSIRGELRFNWKIVIAPERVIDYVVLHELCHLVEHNHSPRFWHLVELAMPDFREQRDWLKKNGHLLDL